MLLVGIREEIVLKGLLKVYTNWRAGGYNDFFFLYFVGRGISIDNTCLKRFCYHKYKIFLGYICAHSS